MISFQYTPDVLRRLKFEEEQDEAKNPGRFELWRGTAPAA
jgi:hypothetical protein